MVLCCSAASTSSPAFCKVRCGVARKKAKQAKETSLSTSSLPPSRKAIADVAEGRPLGFAGKKKKNPEPTWQCVVGCGACCKLDKGPAFPSPEEIFSDDPSQDQLELYKSMVGEDGWCIHYEKASRTCAIYQERPRFCRAEPEVFKDLFGIEEKKFNKEACRSCAACITAAYGSASEELKNFNRAIRGEGNKKS